MSSSSDHEQQVRQWGMFLHLSQFAGYIVPGLGFVAPILIWQMKKEELPELDAHGKNVVNWLISLVIYLAMSSVLIIVVIGIALLVVLGVLAVVFPIIGAIKANNGESWKYPLTISFLK
jgi:hypothetical protein